MKFFEDYNIPIYWNTILVGRRIKLADHQFVEDFATKYLIENPTTNNLNIIELAYGVKDEFIIDYLLQKIVED